MFNYKCKQCDSVCSEFDWNEATRKHYGREFVSIEESFLDLYIYICPACGHKNTGVQKWPN